MTSPGQDCGNVGVEQSGESARRPVAVECFDVAISDKYGNECIIQYPPYRLAESCFVIGLHKAGSVLLNGLVDAICAEIGNCTVPIAGFLFNRGVGERDLPAAEIHRLDKPGYIYNSFRTACIPEQMPSFREAKKLLLVRDPRDVAVSYFFSLLYSHPLPGDGPDRARFQAMRDALASRGASAAVLDGKLDMLFAHQMDFCAHDDAFDNLKVFRYEDVIYAKREWVDAIVRWLDVDLDPGLRASIAERFDVFPDVEDQGAHIRQVAPGNYKSHLGKDAIAYIEQCCAPFFTKFDYCFERH